MSQIKFSKHSTQIGVYYNCVKLDGILDKLAIFLSTEVTCFGGSRWVEFLTADEDGISGNMLDVDKKENNVYISDLYYQGSESQRKYFIISISKLIKLVKEWERLMQEKPDEIVLSEQNGKFELVGHNYCKEPTCGEVES